MAQNPFDQFDAPAAQPAMSANPFDQFDAPAMPQDQMPGSRQTYTAAEVPGAALQNLPASAQRFASGVVGGLFNNLPQALLKPSVVWWAAHST
jgi:hypothetical protein